MPCLCPGDTLRSLLAAFAAHASRARSYAVCAVLFVFAAELVAADVACKQDFESSGILPMLSQRRLVLCIVGIVGACALAAALMGISFK